MSFWVSHFWNPDLQSALYILRFFLLFCSLLPFRLRFRRILALTHRLKSDAQVFSFSYVDFLVFRSGRLLAYIASGVNRSFFEPNFARLQFLTRTTDRPESKIFVIDAVDPMTVLGARSLNNTSRCSLLSQFKGPFSRIKQHEPILGSGDRVTFVIEIEVTNLEFRFLIISCIDLHENFFSWTWSPQGFCN